MEIPSISLPPFSSDSLSLDMPPTPESATSRSLSINTKDFDLPMRRRRMSLTSSSLAFPPLFTPTVELGSLYDLTGNTRYAIRMMPKMERGFFVASNDWTCYRRNYFQLSCSFVATDAAQHPVTLPCILDINNTQHNVIGFAIGISSHVYGHPDKKIDLVQQTAKRDKGPQLLPPLKHVLPTGLSAMPVTHGINQCVATFERLQFKTATANNGKRKAAQQYYTVAMQLYALTQDGQSIVISSVSTSPLVVRGRSPAHYTDAGIDPFKLDTMTPLTSKGSSLSSGSNSSPPPTASAHSSQQPATSMTKPVPFNWNLMEPNTPMTASNFGINVSTASISGLPTANSNEFRSPQSQNSSPHASAGIPTSAFSGLEGLLKDDIPIAGLSKFLPIGSMGRSRSMSTASALSMFTDNSSYTSSLENVQEQINELSSGAFDPSSFGSSPNSWMAGDLSSNLHPSLTASPPTSAFGRSRSLSVSSLPTALLEESGFLKSLPPMTPMTPNVDLSNLLKSVSLPGLVSGVSTSSLYPMNYPTMFNLEEEVMNSNGILTTGTSADSSVFLPSESYPLPASSF